MRTERLHRLHVPERPGRAHRPVLRAQNALAVALAGLLGACGGGGGSSSGGGGDLNEGSYSLADFHYVDQRPPGFHPLGGDGFQVLSRDELCASFPDGTGRQFVLQEGPDQGHAEVPDVVGLFGPDEAVHGLASGQLDEDPESELVVVTIERLDPRLGLYVVDRHPAGNYTRERVATLTTGAWSAVAARVTLGDLDGDFRDELIVTARSAGFGQAASNGGVWVFDDLHDGGSLLLSTERGARHIDLVGLPLDTDGDGRDELVIGLSGDTTDDGRYAVRTYRLEEGAATLRQLHDWAYLYSATGRRDSRAVAGDFDGDGREDLAALRYSRVSNTTIEVWLFSFDGAWEPYANTQLIDLDPASAFPPESWAATTFRPALRRTDLAVVYPTGGGSHSFTSLHYNVSRSGFDFGGRSIDRYIGGQGLTMAALDVDADGAQEIQLALLRLGSTSTLDLGTITADRQLLWQPRRSLASTTAPARPPQVILAPGDYDADGFALQFTGRRSTRLAEPFPIALLSAPPTRAGITQNYDDTESAYSTGTTSAEGIGVTTAAAVTYSTEVGYRLFDVLEFGGRASLSKALERTRTHTRMETVVQGYRGSFVADVLVFQGTLFETYEYRIIGAPEPDAIGRALTLDIPIDANVYNWTVDYYNARVAPEDRIGPDLLTHTPGDPASYPTRAELATELGGEVHWDLPGVHPIGQGTASDFQSVSFGVENASEEQRTVSIGYGGGGGFGLPFFSARGDIDVEYTDGTTHVVSYASETSFEATLGHIADSADYETWRYNWGFSIHTVGRLSDANNEPSGYDPGRKHSFQYLRFWAEPTGSGY